MRVIPPIVTTGNFGISPSMLTSGPAEPGTGETAWNSGTTYAVGDTVYLASTHLRYQSRTASNLNKDPSLATIDTPSADWLVLGPTNKYAAFYALRSTGTAIASGSSIVLTPGVRVDAIGFSHLSNCASVNVSIARTGSPGTPVYTKNTALATRRTGGSFYRWFFTPFTYKTEFALFDLPPLTDAIITITPTSPSGSGNCTIGTCVIGMQEYIGIALQEPENDALNFTAVNRAFDGSITSVVRRRNVPKNSIQVKVAIEDVDRVLEVRDRLNGLTSIYSALDDTQHGYYSAFFRYGIYKRWTVTPKNQDHAIATMEIEET